MIRRLRKFRRKAKLIYAKLSGSGRRDPRSYETCLNCETQLAGKFCHSCGQSSETELYSLRNFSKEVYLAFKKIDFVASLRTSLALLLDPGTFVRGYLAGKRVGFVNPVKFFFYGFAVSITVRTGLEWATGDATFREAAIEDSHLQILDLASTIFWGVLWTVFYRKSGLNSIENAAGALFFQAEVNFIETGLLIVTIPVRALVSDFSTFSAIISFAPMVIYTYYFAIRLFRESVLVTVIKQTVLTVLFVVLVVSLVIGDAVIRSVFTRN